VPCLTCSGRVDRDRALLLVVLEVLLVPRWADSPTLPVLAQRPDLVRDSRQVDGAREVQAPCDGRPATSQLQALEVGMQPGAAPRHRSVAVEDDGRLSADLHRDQPQQNGPGIATSASRAGAQGLPLRTVGECSRAALDPVQSTLSRPGQPRGRHDGAPGAPCPGDALVVGVGRGPEACSDSVSGRMSIRHPVSFAASRAFCPSLPIARESW
jgi:hypothetical protein